MANNQLLLQVTQLNQTISGQHIVKGISFDALSHAVTVFLGPNGAGKTTLLKSVIGLYSLPTTSVQKCILLDGHNVSTLPIHERVARGLLYVPQHTSLFRHLTVRENLQLVYDYHPYWKESLKSFETPDGLLRTSDAFVAERDQLLTQTALDNSLDTYAKHLSGGQQRKVEIIRALLMHPRVILFDEPFAGVDPKSIYELKKLFTQMAHDGIAVVISDHHVDQLLSIASTVYVIMNGQVVTSGSIKDIIENQQLKERYLGSQFHAEVVERFLS